MKMRKEVSHTAIMCLVKKKKVNEEKLFWDKDPIIRVYAD